MDGMKVNEELISEKDADEALADLAALGWLPIDDDFDPMYSMTPEEYARAIEDAEEMHAVMDDLLQEDMERAARERGDLVDEPSVDFSRSPTQSGQERLRAIRDEFPYRNYIEKSDREAARVATTVSLAVSSKKPEVLVPQTVAVETNNISLEL